MDSRPWLALMIGNSRLHWAYFVGEVLAHAWDTPHLSPEMLTAASGEFVHLPIFEATSPDLRQLLQSITSGISILGASVVPNQAQLWQRCQSKIDCSFHLIQLDQLPLLGLYPTMGIDRALAIWGAQVTEGWPCLVIDAGTALTLSAADPEKLLGGAILPGVGLQLRMLHGETAALPNIGLTGDFSMPQRWATNTSDAILSGVFYTLLAGLREYIAHWLDRYPQSPILLTGGDSALLQTVLQEQDPTLGHRLHRDPNLVFWGIRTYRFLDSE